MSHFEFLVLTEKNIFAYKVFLSLNKYFRFQFIFYVKIAKLALLKNVTPSFPASPL